MIYLLLTLISRNSRLRGINSRLGLKKFPSRMATGIGLQAIGLARVFRSRMGGGTRKIAKIPGSTGITGNLGQADWRRGRRAISEVFFSSAITSALGHHASAVRDNGGVGEGDVKSMLAFTRAIAHQCRRRAEANKIAARPTLVLGTSLAARARTVRAIAIAVSALHACAGAKPRNIASASAS